MTARRSIALVSALAVMAALIVTAVVATSSTSTRTVRTPVPAATLSALQRDLGAAARTEKLPALVVPLEQMSHDVTFVSFDRGCLVAFTASSATGDRPANCFFGDTHSSRTLILYGDSNADKCLGAFSALGVADQFRVELVARPSCQITELHLRTPAAHRAGVACTNFRHWALGEIARQHPFATVVTDYEYGRRWDYQHQPVPASVAANALTRTLHAITLRSRATIMLTTPPALLREPLTCLAIYSGAVARCDAPIACVNVTRQLSAACRFDPSTGRTWALVERLPGAVRAARATLVNVEPLFCSKDACPSIVDHLVVNFDLRHVSLHYSVFVSRALGELLAHAGVTLVVP